MIKPICAVKDNASQLFGAPFVVPAVGIAVRSFSKEVNNNSVLDNAMYHNSEDFDLYQLGSYDDERGTFAGSEPVLLTRGVTVRVRG